MRRSLTLVHSGDKYIRRSILCFQRTGVTVAAFLTFKDASCLTCIDLTWRRAPSLSETELWEVSVSI